LISMFVRRESFREYLRRYPVTSVLLGINTLVMLYVLINGGVEESGKLYWYGAMGSEAFTEHQYWRLFTSAFLHAGVMHFLMNMFSILVLAAPLEMMLGRGKYILFFVLTVLASSLSVYFLSNDFAVGASGYGFGVLGLYLYFILRMRGLLDPGSVRTILAFVAINWIYTFMNAGISISGHFGGFLGGFLFGAVFIPSVKELHRIPVWSMDQDGEVDKEQGPDKE